MAVILRRCLYSLADIRRHVGAGERVLGIYLVGDSSLAFVPELESESVSAGDWSFIMGHARKDSMPTTIEMAVMRHPCLIGNGGRLVCWQELL